MASNTCTSDRSAPVLPQNFLISDLGIRSKTGAAETLSLIADNLLMLMDFFGDENRAYTVLDSDQSRRAMHRQLLNMALIIEAVSGALASPDGDCRLVVSLSEEEFARVTALANGGSVDELASAIIRDSLAKVWPPKECRR